MKILRILLFLLLLFIHSHAIGQFSDWFWLSPYPQGNSLFNVTTIGPSVAYAVGRNGTILSTVTAGEYWRSQFNAGGITVTLRSVAFIDEQTGVAVGDSGTIVRTSDGGENWLKVAYPFNGSFNSIKAFNQNLFTIVGDSGIILQSSDGGADWSRKSFNFSPLKLNDITRLDDTTWFAIGDNAVCRSTNAGNHWDSTMIPLGYLRTITFASNNVGYITSWAAFSYVVRTTDRGKTWANQGIAGSGIFGFLGMTFLNPSNGFLVGYDNMYSRGVVFGTTDGGSHWTLSDYIMGDTLQSVAAFPNSCLVVGSDGVILKNYGTPDWFQISSGPPQSLSTICFPRPNIGLMAGQQVFHVAPGERTYIFRTSDGGLTWQQTYAVYQDTTARILCGKDSIVIAAGFGISHSYGTVYRSTNLGVSWSVPSATFPPLTDACRIDSTIWAVGSYILKSTDLGISWDTVLTQDFRTICFVSTSLGWIAGTNEKILHTTNGGISWITQSSPVIFNANSIQFINPDTGIIVGDAGTILRTTNGGNNWVQRPGGTSNILTRCVFVNASQAIAVGAHGTILFTHDAGRTWASLSAPATNNLNDITIVRGGSISALAKNINTYGRNLKNAGRFLHSTYATGLNDNDPIVYIVGDDGLVLAASISPLSARTWTGAVDSDWNRDNNWTPIGTPLPGDSVIIPGAPGNQPIVLLNQDQIVISSLTILSGATLTITDALRRFTVMRDVFISGTLNVQPPSSTTIIIGGNWIINPGGSSAVRSVLSTLDQGFLPAQSTVYFEGSGILEGDFYNLVFDTASGMTSQGNVSVLNECTVFHDLQLRASDTLFILNPTAASLAGDKTIVGGTISRELQQGTTVPFRFESPLSYLKFNNSGTFPSSVAMTTFPNHIPPPSELQWQVVGGVVDTVNHTIRVDSIRKFSRWVLGVPHVLSASGDPVVNREYKISPSGGSSFVTELQLAYQPSEVPAGTVESTLRLLRGAFYTGSLAANWNMMSLPLNPDESSIDSLFPTAISPAYSYAGQYNTEFELRFGTGYWIRFPNIPTVTMCGDYYTSNTINVNAGWNMIGGITFPVAKNDVSTIPTGLIASSFFGYDNGYTIVDTLQPMRAYWVKLSANGSIILTSAVPEKIARSTTAQTTSDLSKYNQLIIRSAGEEEQTLYFGKGGKATDLRRFELPPVPPDGVFDARFATERMLELNDKNQPKDIAIHISSARYPVTIQWNINEQGTGDILVVGGEKEIVLKGKGEIQVRDPQSKINLRLEPGLGQTLFPKEYALDQNYPNPFNPITRIEYQLPEESRVKVRVYNLLGQILDVLRDDIEDAGYKHVEWDASKVTSGVYICRFEAASTLNPAKTYMKIKKMLLVK